MPLWGWFALAGIGYLLLSGRSSSYLASTSQGDVRSRTPEDWQALWSTAQQLGTTPQVIGLVLFEESGMDPGARNTNGYPNDPTKWCGGVNQFCPGTYEYWVNVPMTDYLTWSMAEQLVPIGNFWAAKPHFTTSRDLFWLNFLPASYVEGADPSTVVNDPSKMNAHYATVTVPASNPALFPNGKTVLTAGDIDDYLAAQAQAPGWQYALQQIAANAPSNVVA